MSNNNGSMIKAAGTHGSKGSTKHRGQSTYSGDEFGYGVHNGHKFSGRKTHHRNHSS